MEQALQNSEGKLTANLQLYTHLNYKLSVKKDTDVLKHI